MEHTSVTRFIYFSIQLYTSFVIKRHKYAFCYQDGRTALSVAVTCDSESAAKLVTLLIDNGANPNISDKDGMSPLLIAAFEGRGFLYNIKRGTELEMRLT